ncbi:TetR/AcrR family transcriptional regulator [Nocardia sp. MDA0666]|uniref:TetR/AcrR family transcriptional regulator n=1 Tax=Nocardia sp. MDA0666 TaxID=2135448 RepID=UPI000D13E4B4|nr:TetR/AcrR family transcriptional regulator [Nocardia sp. MDA0666]PSR66901.1 TetR/AcrR family transcriptional regulator [Nocardia sp. MDA0666]
MSREQTAQRKPISDDLRVLRSRGLLQAAILKLGQERPVDGIAISDITQRAGVSRSTFYDHYTDKETLLADAMDRQALEAGVPLRTVGLDEGLPGQPPQFLIDYLQHIADHAQLYRNVLGAHGSAAVHARLTGRIAAILGEGIGILDQDAPVESPVPPAVDAVALAGAILAVITYWLERVPQVPTADVAVWIWEIITRE